MLEFGTLKKSMTEIQETIEDLVNVERPQVDVLKKVQVTPQIILPAEEESEFTGQYCQVLGQTHSNVLCLAKEDEDNSSELVQYNEDENSFRSIIKLDKKVRVVVQHGDRLVCDDMVYKLRSDGKIMYI